MRTNIAVTRMKRMIALAMVTALVGSALAQGTFTIRRPADGSRVRETVAVRIPRNSIPATGYLGIVVNGRFLEAVRPPVEGEDYVYRLDTKARRLPDGPMTIEVILYLGSDTRPTVLNRSSVQVTLDNSASIRIPENGLSLRYRFSPGREDVYRMSLQSTLATVSQAQAALGSRPFELVLEEENLRYLVAHANRYSNGDGLLRLQPLPEKGKDYAMLTASGDTEPRKYMDYEMAPIFMRVSSTGREIFSSLPPYFPNEGTSGDFSRLDLFGLFPLPVLPSRGVRPGTPWQAPFQQVNLDLDNRLERERFTTALPARATLEAVEWEMGMPCAKVRVQLQLGSADLRSANATNTPDGELQSIRLDEVYWFALDRGIMVRKESNIITEQIVQANQVGGGFGSGGGSGAAAGGPSTGRGGPPGGAPGRGRPEGGAPRDGRWNNLGQIGGLQGVNMLRQAAVSQGGPEGFNSGQTGDGRAPGGAGGGSVGVRTILRTTQRITMTLER